jgi:hypothetical protein
MPAPTLWVLRIRRTRRARHIRQRRAKKDRMAEPGAACAYGWRALLRRDSSTLRARRKDHLRAARLTLRLICRERNVRGPLTSAHRSDLPRRFERRPQLFKSLWRASNEVGQSKITKAGNESGTPVVWRVARNISACPYSPPCIFTGALTGQRLSRPQVLTNQWQDGRALKVSEAQDRERSGGSVRAGRWPRRP